MNGALKKRLETVETAHSTRERDWHVLADKWKDYETKAIAENQRWVGSGGVCMWEHAQGLRQQLAFELAGRLHL